VTPAEKLADGIDVFIDFVGRITAWSSFALALVMGANVLMRYGFNTGSIWAQELEWHLMSPICLFGMSYALRHGEHVRVDVLYASFSQRTKDLIGIITALIAMAISVIVIDLSISYVLQSWNIGEGTANPGGISARYILKSLIPIGFALFFIQSLAEAIRCYLAWRSAG
jgi:TRAP-type mannitol/chloroaromatic compound transport system permease small subunit